MDFSQFDLPTQGKLEEAKAILSYKANNDKMLRMHKAESKTRIIFGGRRCLPLDYQVLRANGEFADIDSLKIGDEILGVDLDTGVATTTRVIDKTYPGKKDIYKIELVDGTSCRASIEHTFPVYSRHGKLNSHGKLQKPINYTVERLIGTLENKACKKVLIQAKEVHFSGSDSITIDPYLLGALLGDGSLPVNSSISITNVDEEILTRISRIVEDDGFQLKLARKDDITYSIIPKERKRRSNGSSYNSLRDRLREYKLIGNGKFIPKVYLTSTIEVRKQVLAGLIDTDGSVDEFVSKYKELAEGFCFLVRSLGGKATLSESIKTCCNNGVVGVYYRVYWRLNCDLPLSLKYKNPHRQLDLDYSKRRILDIYQIGEESTVNITVDHPDHNFIGENWVITGNSGKTQWGAVECVWAGLGIHPFGLFPPPPLQIRICGMDLNAGVKGILLPTMYSWLPKSSVKKFWAEEKLLELTNGTLYDFKSYDQDLEKFEGAARDLVWMDEEPPKEIYQSNYYRTLYAGSNGKLLITCTPLHGMTWIYDDLYDNPEAVPPYVDYEHVSIFENPHLDKAAVEATLKDPAMRDSIEAAMYGRFISKTGLVYKEFEEKIHVKEIIGKVPDENMIIVGIDPHNRNPHGIIFVMLDRENVWTVFDEILDPDVKTPEQMVNAIKAKIPSRWPPQMSIMDTYGNSEQSISGMSLKEYFNNKLGFHTIDAHKDVNQGMLQVKTLLNPGEGKLPKLYITRNCVQTAREFRHYVWDDWARRKERKDPKEKPIKKDDHLLDALRYVVMSNIVYRHPGFTRSGMVSKKDITPNQVTGYF